MATPTQTQLVNLSVGKESSPIGSWFDLLSNLDKDFSEVIGVDGLKEKLKSIPDRLTASKFVGSAYEEGGRGSPVE